MKASSFPQRGESVCVQCEKQEERSNNKIALMSWEREEEFTLGVAAMQPVARDNKQFILPSLFPFCASSILFFFRRNPEFLN